MKKEELHELNGQLQRQLTRLGNIAACLNEWREILMQVRESRERAIALTKLDEAVQWSANAVASQSPSRNLRAGIAALQAMLDDLQQRMLDDLGGAE